MHNFHQCYVNLVIWNNLHYSLLNCSGNRYLRHFPPQIVLMHQWNREFSFQKLSLLFCATNDHDHACSLYKGSSLACTIRHHTYSSVEVISCVVQKESFIKLSIFKRYIVHGKIPYKSDCYVKCFIWSQLCWLGYK